VFSRNNNEPSNSGTFLIWARLGDVNQEVATGAWVARFSTGFSGFSPDFSRIFTKKNQDFPRFFGKDEDFAPVFFLTRII
jgi:hypothetical protein